MDIKQQIIYVIGIFAIFMIVALLFNMKTTTLHSVPMMYPKSAEISKRPAVNVSRPNYSFDEFTTDLKTLARQIDMAKKHVRGTKSGDALTGAIKTVSIMLKNVKLDYSKVVKRFVKKSESICPEVYNGTRIGYPAFDTGFVVQPCSYSKKLNDLITILIVYDSTQTFDIQVLLRSIRQYHSTVPVIIASTTPKVGEKSVSSFKNVRIESIFADGSSNIGMAWNKIITKVTTAYTLVARGVIWFNFDARLDRLIRQIERLNVTSAGGAFRDIEGNWIKGCQQRVMRNFTLVYEAGYDESYEACVFCDHIDGPFVIKTNILKNKSFKAEIQQGLFEDLFLRMTSTEHIICPDSMFYTNITERSNKSTDWKSFVKVWPVQKIKFSGREILMPTPSKYPCYSGRGTALSPWCHKENADLVNAAMKVCKDVGVVCELDSGTIMGSVKFHSVLPWERDADVCFITANFSAIKGAKQTWAKMGYRASIQNTVKCCYKNTTLPFNGYVGLRSRNWRLEMWGMATLPSEPHRMHYH